MNCSWLVLYDIADPKRLRVVAKILETEGVRVQKSLFECNWSNEYVKLIEKKLREIVVSGKDYVLIFPRCELDLYKTMKIGKGSKIENHKLPFMVL